MLAWPNAKTSQRDHSVTSRHPITRLRPTGIPLDQQQLAAVITVQQALTRVPVVQTITQARPRPSDCNGLCVGPAADGKELDVIWTQSATDQLLMAVHWLCPQLLL